MADIFDITSNKKARGAYDEPAAKYDWESSKVRRDPRLKSPVKQPEQNKFDDKTSHRTTSGRDPRDEEKPNSENWMSKQSSQEYRQTNNYPMQAQPPLPPIYDARQQYNTSYPPPMNPSQQQQSSYQYHPSDYPQTQYHLQQPYYPLSGNGSYMQAPPPASNVWQNAPSAPEFRDMNRPQQTAHIHTAPLPNHPQPEVKTDDLKKEAIAQEVKKHRATLRKQRGEYLQKSTQLRRELDMLKAQKQQLMSEFGAGTIPRETQRILKENTKLQEEIQTKLKAMNDVIDMLSGIISDGASTTDENSKREQPYDRNPPPAVERDTIHSNKEAEKKTPPSPDNGPAYNYVHYDPELHWCRVCDVFPNSAKDLLLHMHSDQHRDTTRQHQMVDMPWHNLPTDQELPSTAGAPIKRTPIKGLQFFISAPAWYCKLCDKWIGDLHCASLHLKAKLHIQNYTHFVEQNPHWETDWITDREKAFARSHKKGSEQNVADTSALPEASSPEHSEVSTEQKSKKRKKRGKEKRDSRSSSREKKKKKKSKKRKKVVSSDSSSATTSSTDSSSDEDGDRSKSIRVAMRNKMKMQAQMMLSEELNVLTKLVEDGKQRKSRQAAVANAAPPAPTPNSEAPTLLKDNEILSLQSFRSRVKQTAGFKQSQAVSLGLAGDGNENTDQQKQGSQADIIQRESESYERSHKDRVARYSGSTDRKLFDKYESSDKKRYDERYNSPNRKRSFDRYASPLEVKKYYDKYASPKKYNERYSPPDRKKNYERHENNDYRNKRYGDDKYGRGKSENANKYNRDDRTFPKSKEEFIKTDEYESKFEKQTAASAAKQTSKSPLMTIQQKKLPFIGRMPLFKKKSDSDEKKPSEEKMEVKSKFSSKSTNKKNLPAPGLVHITQLSTPPEFKFNAENPPPPPQIIPDPPQIIPEPPQISAYLCPPAPPILTHGEQQHEEVPIIMPATTDSKGPLPRDLQDALNIIFPGDKPKDDGTAEAHEAMMMSQYQIMEGYGFPGTINYDQDMQNYVMASMPPLPPQDGDVVNTDDKDFMEVSTEMDDLAMLGIDAEDLAAQQL